MYNLRWKLCVTYTRHYFTNGFSATVISEAKNSSMKASGRKEKMANYTLSDHCKMVLSWETSLDAKAMKEIADLLVSEKFKERPWSDHCESAFDLAIERCHSDVKAVEGTCPWLAIY